MQLALEDEARPADERMRLRLREQELLDGWFVEDRDVGYRFECRHDFRTFVCRKYRSLGRAACSCWLERGTVVPIREIGASPGAIMSETAASGTTLLEPGCRVQVRMLDRALGGTPAVT